MTKTPEKSSADAAEPAPETAKPDSGTPETATSGTDAPGTDKKDAPKEIGGRCGLDPTRYGDWEKAGRCVDF